MTTATEPSPNAASNDSTAEATSVPRASAAVLRMSGATSPSRTDLGGTNAGAATESTRAASAIDCAGMRYPIVSSCTRAALRRGEMSEHVVPAVGRERTRRLREVADDRHRTVQGAARQHPQCHRREVLRLVDDDVSVGAQLVGLGAVARRPRTEQRERLIEQRDVRVGPHHLVDVRGSSTHQPLDLVLVERATCREAHQRR